MPRRQIHGPAIFNATLSFQHSSFKTLPPLEIFFLFHPRSGESHKSIEHAAVSSGSCVYIGAGLARNSCLFRDIMVTRKWKRIFPSSTRKTLEDFSRRVDIEGRNITVQSSKKFVETLVFGVPCNI